MNCLYILTSRVIRNFPFRIWDLLVWVLVSELLLRGTVGLLLQTASDISSRAPFIVSRSYPPGNPLRINPSLKLCPYMHSHICTSFMLLCAKDESIRLFKL